MTDYTNAPAITPVVGKRHRMRNGEVTGVVRQSRHKIFTFEDENDSWTKDGYCFLSGKTSFDIVAVIEDECDAQAPNSPADGKVGLDAHTVRHEVLDAAADAVLRDRNATYDAPEHSFGLIAAYWSAHLDARILPHDVAVMMALLKLARIKASPEHRDSWVDLAGYAACGAEVAQANNGEDVE